MKYINLKTEIPNPKDIQFIESLKKYEARSMFNQLPVVWDKAEDCIVTDRHGNKFLDFTSGICVTNTGHGNIHIREELKKIINKPLLYSYTFATEVRLAFIKRLIDMCYPEGKAFLVSSGTEAVEVACKLLRMYGLAKNKNKQIIISVKDAMHGRTMLAERLKGRTEDNEWAGEGSDILHIHFPTSQSDFYSDIENLDIQNGNICGIILEAYQGWSATFYPHQYIFNLMNFCKRHDILVCWDEIQGGFGRTGRLFTFQHYQILPDLICCGKGISGSVPLSAVIGRKDILDIPKEGSMSSTFSANPLACAAGLGNLKRIMQLTRDAEVKGSEMFNYLRNELKLEDVRGWGLLCAIITKTKEEADRIVWGCFKRGLLLIWTHKNSVKIAPSLTITFEAIEEGLNIIKEVMNETLSIMQLSKNSKSLSRKI